MSPERAAALVDAALERRHLLRLQEDAGPLIAGLPAEAQPFAEFVLVELARQAARHDALEAVQEAAARSREERIRLDPLRFIPKDRLAAAGAATPEAEQGPVAVDVADPDFTGFGWWEAERTEGGSLRWSGFAPAASVLLPALGGGELVLTISVRAPFGIPLEIADHPMFLDARPLVFSTVSNNGVVGIFEARVTLEDRPAGSRATLVLQGPQYEDPAKGPRRDTRRIGLGLCWVRVERA